METCDSKSLVEKFKEALGEIGENQQKQSIQKQNPSVNESCIENTKVTEELPNQIYAKRNLLIENPTKSSWIQKSFMILSALAILVCAYFMYNKCFNTKIQKTLVNDWDTQVAQDDGIMKLERLLQRKLDSTQQDRSLSETLALNSTAKSNENAFLKPQKARFIEDEQQDPLTSKTHGQEANRGRVKSKPKVRRGSSPPTTAVNTSMPNVSDSKNTPKESSDPLFTEF